MSILEEGTLRDYLSQPWKLFITIFCFFAFIVMGVYIELAGPTLDMLSLQIASDMARIAWIVAARSLGNLIGVVLFGIIFHSIIKKQTELLLAVAYFIPAFAMLVTPYIKSLFLLCVALFSEGVSQGMGLLVTKMWGARATSPLNAALLGYPCGALIAVLLIRFSSADVHILVDPRSYNESTPVNKLPTFQPRLVPAYSAASVLCTIVTISFIIIAIKEHKRTPIESEKTKRIITGQKSVDDEELRLRHKPKRVLNKAIFWKSCSPTTCGSGYMVYGILFKQYDTSDFEEEFYSIDRQRKGYIAQKDVRDLMSKYKNQFSQRQIHERLQEMGLQNSNDKITLDEYVDFRILPKASSSPQPQLSTLQTTAKQFDPFQFFDKNEDHHIDQYEIIQSYKDLGLNITEQEVKTMIKCLDVNKDGRIDQREFNLVKNHATMDDN
ncbi:unnamed protein product [Didymodactylos carnosus]|uniref:EF-hand domain-containing protein n=1 Tax=Didymodactylos carnosus TaxID=1234261 RepID=A0A814YKU4_9BILA|nr:unnamed protein product [Didymodactylos carnosus]CAF1230508.1 unnamed protein product [Didymodactylos carnosus]CAF3806476.1 unnamed protein product [Didymodactylos carnosus]CAF3993192.1 unnamed protein product [Didymodactylos carnosus]